MKTSTDASAISKYKIGKRTYCFMGTTFIFMVGTFTMLFFGSCAKKIVFPVSQSQPAALCNTLIKTDKNGNYSINLSVKHLASPDRLTPARKCYVIWSESSQNGVHNLGQLHVAKSMSGSLKAVSTFKPVSIFITAEDDPTIKEPAGETVLKSESIDLK